MEFRRGAGEGGASQRWIDRNLPTCPLCRSRSLWESATGADQLALNRWVFRCPNCRAVLSTIPDSPVASPMNFRDPVATVKTPVTQNVRIDSVERSQDEDFVGEEFPLAELQEWAREDQG